MSRIMQKVRSDNLSRWCYVWNTMSATLRTLPTVAKIVLAVGLLCGIVFAQMGYARPVALVCAVAGPSQPQAVAAPAVNCQDCCAAMLCCLLSKKASDAPVHPEPLSNDRSSQLDHAPVAVTLTPVPSFNFLAPPQLPKVIARSRVAAPRRECAPRGAVSCIWLI